MFSLFLPLFCADETQWGRNSCPRSRLGFQFGLFYVFYTILFYVVSRGGMGTQLWKWRTILFYVVSREGGGGREGTQLWKWRRCSSEIFQNTPKSTRISFCGRGFELIYTPIKKRYQFWNNKLVANDMTVFKQKKLRSKSYLCNKNGYGFRYFIRLMT